MSGGIENTPKLRFPEFSGEWRSEKLGEEATFSKGKGISKSDIDPLGITPCIRYGELYTDYDTVIDEPNSKTSVSPNSLKLSKGGEVIVPASGEDAKDIATAAVVLRSGVALGGDLNVIQSEHDGAFLASYLSGKKRLPLASMAQGNSVVHLYPDQLATLDLHFPELPEQQKIAAFLGAVDAKIGQLTRKKALLEDYKKGCMQQLFTQKLRFKDDNGNDFPDWETTKMEDIGTIKKGTQLNRDDMIQEGAFPVINGGVTASGYTNTFNAPGGSITISEGGNSCGHVAWQSRDFWLGGHCYVVSANDQKGVLTKFLFHSLRHNQAKIMRLRVGSGLPNIQKGDLLQLTLGIPHPDEQQKIADFLSAIDAKISLVADELSAAQDFKKGLLQQMFV